MSAPPPPPARDAATEERDFLWYALCEQPVCLTPAVLRQRTAGIVLHLIRECGTFASHNPDKQCFARSVVAELKAMSRFPAPIVHIALIHIGAVVCPTFIRYLSARVPVYKLKPYLTIVARTLPLFLQRLTPEKTIVAWAIARSAEYLNRGRPRIAMLW
jgi:hypothetical protein